MPEGQAGEVITGKTEDADSLDKRVKIAILLEGLVYENDAGKTEASAETGRKKTK